MLPVHRWLLCGLGALWSCAAFAQAASAPPEVDESKIPDWVKRQARSPYRVIIESNTVRPKPAPAKDDDSARRALKKPVAKAAPAAPAPPPAASAAVLADGAKPSPATSTGAAPAAVNANTTTLPVPAPEAPVERAAVPEPAKAAALAPRPGPVPAPLTLLTQVEPVLPRELANSRVDGGEVVVAFTVNPDGEVANVSVTSSTDPRLSKSVLRAVRSWRYAPIPEARDHRVSFSFKSE